MRAVVTRVNHATVHIGGELQAKIGKGLLVFLGVHRDDTEKEALKIADKICGLRIFEDEAGKMNLAPGVIRAEILIVSQFTLFAAIASRIREYLIRLPVCARGQRRCTTIRRKTSRACLP